MATFHLSDKSNKLDTGCASDTFPYFKKPIVSGYYSLDEKRTFHSCGRPKYVYHGALQHNQKVYFNLNFGLENTLSKAYTNEKLDNLLKWLTSRSRNSVDDAFVCFRGLLTLIMCTPYERNEGWVISAQLIGRSIFLCEIETQEKKRKRDVQNEKQKTFMAWGYKFEQYMLSDDPNIEPNVTKPVNECEEFCCVFRSQLDCHHLLFGAEMDGIICDKPLDFDKTPCALEKADFVELKTNRVIDTFRQEQNFLRYKLLKWWLQSFLVGIEKIICGFRDDLGIVQRLKHYNVQDLPKMAKGQWDPCVCMNFGVQFFNFVKERVNSSADSQNVVWKFCWMPGNPVVAMKISDTTSEFHFVPDWFTKATQEELLQEEVIQQ